jgi:hypothetical protein
MKNGTSSFGKNVRRSTASLLRNLQSVGAALFFILVSPAAVSADFTIDTAGTSLTGLWWNPSESGWGTAITHEYGMIFVTLYTYDASKKPVWYVASSCPVTANQCSGTLYAVQGGTPLSAPWNGSRLAVTPAGTLNLVFSDTHTGTMTYTINGASGSRQITRNLFASGTTLPVTDYSGLWWNPNESGWGVALTRQADMGFATIYTYDASGQPVWYVASSCPMVGSGCSGSLYAVTGGTPLTTAWNASNLAVSPVGTLNLAFTNANSGTMSFTVNGVGGSKAIERNVFATPPVAPTSDCSSGATPAGLNYAQSGNTISVTTTGCIPVPTAGLCSASSPQATGINVLSTNTTASTQLSGITFNIPGMPNPLDAAAATYAEITLCTQNAPSSLSRLNINYNICYDITSQIASSLAPLQASGMVTVSNPVTVAAQGRTTMRAVADCTASGADVISDAFTGKVWIKKSDGTYLAVN